MEILIGAHCESVDPQAEEVGEPRVATGAVAG